MSVHTVQMRKGRVIITRVSMMQRAALNLIFLAVSAIFSA